MMRGQYNVHTYVHKCVWCGITLKKTSVIGVARATHCVCWCSVVAVGVI